MKFKYIRTSEVLSGDEKEIEINTLEELMEFQKTSGSSIILNGNSIEIYDDYRE